MAGFLTWSVIASAREPTSFCTCTTPRIRRSSRECHLPECLTLCKPHQCPGSMPVESSCAALSFSPTKSKPASGLGEIFPRWKTSMARGEACPGWIPFPKSAPNAHQISTSVYRNNPCSNELHTSQVLPLGSPMGRKEGCFLQTLRRTVEGGGGNTPQSFSEATPQPIAVTGLGSTACASRTRSKVDKVIVEHLSREASLTSSRLSDCLEMEGNATC